MSQCPTDMKIFLLTFILSCVWLTVSAQDTTANNQHIKSTELKEVTVYSTYNSTGGNTFKYNAVQAASSISVIGEPDVLRHISSLPGVSQGVESSLGLYVRGANTGSNGLYFNDVPIYYTSHLMGMFSVFPADMVDDANFYMGGFPASKGNLSSSLLDIAAKRADATLFNGKITFSPFLSGLYTAIPIVKNRVSMQVAGRTSFMPQILNMFDMGKFKFDFQLYDISSKLDVKISDRQYLDAMFFKAKDNMGYSLNWMANSQGYDSWFGKLGWHFDISKQLNLYVWCHYNKAYSVQRSSIFDEFTRSLQSHLSLSSQLDEWTVNGRLNYNLNDKWNFNAGWGINSQKFNPGNEKFVINSEAINNSELMPNTLVSLFCESQYSPNKRFNFRLGYRKTYQFQNNNSNAVSNFDLHFLNRILLCDNYGLELSLDRMNQYYHILEGLPTGWSMNMMVPADKEYPAELTHQGYIGFWNRKKLKRFNLYFTVGGYYRFMQNIVTYLNAINAYGFKSKSWREDVDLGKGNSYGLEVSANLQGNRIGATVAYSLSKADREFPKLNNGHPFPFKFDRRHILNLQTKFTISKYQNRKGAHIEHFVNNVLAYSTGNRSTLPLGRYEGVAPPYWDQNMGGHLYPDEFYNNIYDRQLMSSRNGYKMKDYFRVDIAYTLIRVGQKTTNEFTVSVFNLLNRHNPYTYFQENKEWKQLSLIPIFPSVRWAISW